MKFGFRTPNLEKKLKAKTTGAVKRKVKSVINPMYGKKGIGIITDPKKALYNKIYNKTTIDPLKMGNSTKHKVTASEEYDDFEIDRDKVIEYIYQDDFENLISKELSESTKTFILSKAVDKIISGELLTDEAIEEFITTSSRNIRINSKLIPFMLKVGGIIFSLFITYLIIFK
ncbi:hypothetical protein [Fusobacterium varium]|uniref:hypothetical protein n=1 Tax=Fusobacterium varium TaxID=856 RepID=UPI001F232039|nr:hypothetical protein [Fusobacterium varium]MCF2674327.1 hypothetical protein [Fusobacterium varium]